MNLEEASYITNYFPRLMNQSEKEARKHYLLNHKLGKTQDYSSFNLFEKRKHFFTNKFKLKQAGDFLELLDGGFENFIINTAKRIKRDSPYDYIINRCPECQGIARTPYARQCRKCSHNWHHEKRGYFQFQNSFRLYNRPYFWIMGKLLKGELKQGYLIDFTNSQINLLAKIEKIEFGLKTTNDTRQEFPCLGISVAPTHEELIDTHLNQFNQQLMIIERN